MGPDASLVRGPVWAGPGTVAGCLQAAAPFSCPGGRVQPVIPSSPHGVGLPCREQGGGSGSAAALRPASLPPVCLGVPVGAWGRGPGVQERRRYFPPLCRPPERGGGLWALASLVAGAGSPAQADTAASAGIWDRWDLWCIVVGWGRLSSAGLSFTEFAFKQFLC